MSAPGDDDAVPPVSQKASPETLALRAKPRSVVKFRRGVVIGTAAVGALALAGFGWMALSAKAVRLTGPAENPAVEDRAPSRDAVAALPKDYTAPKLGPPLPGDLGRAVVDQQRRVEAPPPVSSASTQVDQAAEAERQRLAAMAHQAREAGVMVQATARRAGETANAPVGVVATPVAAPSSSGAEQQGKQAFVEKAGPAEVYNAHQLEGPRSPYQLMAGSIIAASLITGLDSDLAGQVIAQVTEPVYDTATGAYLLIPQGARLIGVYDSVVAFGQTRALLVWQRLILPDGSSIPLDNLPATDAAGYAGLADKVDFHTWQMLKGVGLSTLLGVGTEISFGDDESDLVRAVRQSTQQSASQAAQQVVSKQLDVQPTLRVRPGWPLRVIVHRDLILRPWRA
ncbi:TrbI/VirB10 family protein [Caulobacter sp. LARHSG274]